MLIGGFYKSLICLALDLVETMVDHKKEREIQLMRMMLVAAQTVIIVNDVQETTIAGPLPISVDNTAQNFEGWGTSLAWFGDYVGTLEGMFYICLFACLNNTWHHIMPGA